jgi:hypothetical protein
MPQDAVPSGDVLGFPLAQVQSVLRGESYRVVIYSPRQYGDECQLYCVRQRWCQGHQEWELVFSPSPVLNLPPPG